MPIWPKMADCNCFVMSHKSAASSMSAINLTHAPARCQQPFRTQCCRRRAAADRRCSTLVCAQSGRERGIEERNAHLSFDRRAMLAALGAALATTSGCGAALAEEEDAALKKAAEKVQKVVGKVDAARDDMKVYFGLASPPTSYGGYGGNASEDAKYYFSYPENWKVEVVNKVKKGMQGIDAILYEKKGKGFPSVFVVTFSRAGEDNKTFALNDAEKTFQGFAGADYDLQDALTEAQDLKQDKREIDGSVYYDYEIESPTVNYLATVTVQTGKVFALFVKGPPKAFAADPRLRLVQQSFRTIPIEYKRSSGQV